MNDQLTEAIIGAAYKVHNQLGFGFFESVYEKSLAIELSKLRLKFSRQHPIKVFYDDQVVGDFIGDMLVDERVIVELKSVRSMTKEHEVQVVNYLVATRIEIGLLINFGPSGVEVKRKHRTFRPEE